MSYVVLARKYRPQTLDDVVGQEHIVQTLKNALKSDRLAQSFLFVGSRGVGKTSTARILAKILNCTNRKDKEITPCNKCDSCREITDGRSLDVLEIDGASNRGIDEIRNLRENVKFKPTSGSYKIYIIDEVHMLTQEAFNALLKTLEEPPAHVKFIFATTEAHRVLPTIISRCQRYDFRRIAVREIAATLNQVAKKEKIKIEEEALFAIAKAAEGSLRDGESILDQLINYSKGAIDVATTENVLGFTKDETYLTIARAIQDNDSQVALTLIQKIVNEGKDIRQFCKGLIELFRDILMTMASSTPKKLIDRQEDSIKTLQELGKKFTLQDVLYSLTVLQNTYAELKYSTFPQINVEIAIVKLTEREDMVRVSELLNSLEELEKKTPVKSSEETQHSLSENIQAEAYYKRDNDGYIQGKINTYIDRVVDKNVVKEDKEQSSYEKTDNESVLHSNHPLTL